MARNLRTSERSTWKRCPTKWKWSYVDGLRSKGPPDKNMWFGSGIHLALAKWYLGGTKRGIKPMETWTQYIGNECTRIRTLPGADTSWESSIYEDAFELGYSMLEQYLKIYGKDESWSFLETEKQSVVNIGGVNYYYTFDGVYKNLETQENEVLETKTCATIRTGHLELDDQAGSYWAIAAKKYNIAGVNYNFLRKVMPDSRPVNSKGQYLNKPNKMNYIHAIANEAIKMGTGGTLENFQDSYKSWTIAELDNFVKKWNISVEGAVSAMQPAPAFARELILRRPGERRNQLKRIVQEAEVMQRMKNGEIPIWKTPHYTCKSQCEFHLMCTLHESGADWRAVADRMFIKGDPYAEYIKSTEQDN